MTVSDIQRWDFFGEVGINEPVRYLHLEAVKGRYVTYADHVAAVAAAEQRAGEEAHGHYMDGYNKAWSLSAAEIERQVREEEQVAQTLARAELYSMEEMDERCTQAADEAFAAGVKAAREAVAALAPTWAVKFYVNRPSNGEWIGCNGAHEQVDVLAAIDALTTRGKEGR